MKAKTHIISSIFRPRIIPRRGLAHTIGLTEKRLSLPLHHCLMTSLSAFILMPSTLLPTQRAFWTGSCCSIQGSEDIGTLNLHIGDQVIELAKVNPALVLERLCFRVSCKVWFPGWLQVFHYVTPMLVAPGPARNALKFGNDAPSTFLHTSFSSSWGPSWADLAWQDGQLLLA